MNAALFYPVANVSLEQILYIFLKEKYISDPGIFSLHNFSIEELTKKSFDKVGDDFFCLYEKKYRTKNSNSDFNMKLYFHENNFMSNGVDFSIRICTYLAKFKNEFNDFIKINSIEILLDDYFESGSLIVNEFIEMRFGKIGRPKAKKKFHLMGISTDYEVPLKSTKNKISTHGARIRNTRLSFDRAMKLAKQSSALFELITLIKKDFPSAI